MHSTCFHLREKGISFESFDHVNPVAAVDAVSLFKLSLLMRSLAPLFFLVSWFLVSLRNRRHPRSPFSHMDKHWFWHVPWLTALSSLSARPIKLNLIPLRCWRRRRKERKREKSQEKEIIGPYLGYLSLLSYIDIDDSFPPSSKKILRLTQ